MAVGSVRFFFFLLFLVSCFCLIKEMKSFIITLVKFQCSSVFIFDFDIIYLVFEQFL